MRRCPRGCSKWSVGDDVTPGSESSRMSQTSPRQTFVNPVRPSPLFGADPRVDRDERRDLGTYQEARNSFNRPAGNALSSFGWSFRRFSASLQPLTQLLGGVKARGQSAGFGFGPPEVASLRCCCGSCIDPEDPRTRTLVSVKLPWSRLVGQPAKPTRGSRDLASFGLPETFEPSFHDNVPTWKSGVLSQFAFRPKWLKRVKLFVMTVDPRALKAS